MNTCKTPSCPNQATRKGLCPKHYMREYRRKHKARLGYEDGIEEGRRQVIDAINSLIEPHGGKCYIWHGHSVYLELQGQTLKALLDDV